ncbi:hypothetical protein TREPR_3142 [Treponema primitia ZAS-2]|uniref:Uncharacterized protein n=1 Tax=Treponema primitia (strain ATCC BAA-887 / DSM 12427 / ZAS-2) TaxID=545694 RepID=F5YLT7_TREPZ|nr:hypothetical protein [Treponema primitia]AEF84100.1 hypothetical protein TREPR_3142 [Treponema primitia ZAS-2]
MVFLLIMALGACGDPVIPQEYTVVMPSLPSLWEETLGQAHWRLIWLNQEGVYQTAETAGGKAAVSVVQEWATGILAFPYWPSRGVLPGEMRPAGGIFPFDAKEGSIYLSWQGGPEAWFYREMAAATEASADPGKRRPEYFDWPRFRSLLASSSVPPEIQADPWRADWTDIAVRTVKSGFDRRRISLRKEVELPVSREALLREGPGQPGETIGPFIGPSPFAKPVIAEPGVGFRFRVGAETDTYVSAGGLLRVSRSGWMWVKAGN